jgi:hypothetical protein
LRKCYCQALLRLRDQSRSNSHGRPGSQDRPNHSGGARQKRTSTALDPSPDVKKVCLGLPDASKEVVIGANLDPK